MTCNAERKLHVALMALAVAAATVSLDAQAPLDVQQKTDAARTAPDIAELEKHIDEMSARIDSMRQELIDSRNEVQAMHTELSELRRELTEKNAADTETAVSTLRTSVEQLQETSDVLEAQVKQHDQTKVETASKFPLRVWRGPGICGTGRHSWSSARIYPEDGLERWRLSTRRHPETSDRTASARPIPPSKAAGRGMKRIWRMR
jgi:regulator of replication initiation timing